MAEAASDPNLLEYFSECDEIIQRLSDQIRTLEKMTSGHIDVDQIYRDIHTLKGTSQLFGFQHIGQIGHVMETCLDPVRKGRILPHQKLIDALYRCLTAIEKILASLRAKRADDFGNLLYASIPELMDSSIIAAGGSLGLFRLPLLAPEFIKPVEAPSSVSLPPVNSSPDPASVATTTLISSAQPTPQPTVNPPVIPVIEPPLQSSDPLSLAAEVIPVRIKEVPVSQENHTTAPTTVGSASPASQDQSESNTTIRVPVALLDKLMTLMGEMVLVRNQVLQYANKSDQLEFHNLSQRLDVVTSEIQGEVMKTRMQPIGNILSKFQRVIRDLSRDLNKKVELTLSGVETELDKTLLEAVKDPLMHIVRNSCDHGIESGEERLAAGKPEKGTIAIRSFHEGGQVIIEITDDGRGLHREKLVNKAIEKGIITPEKAAAMSDRESFNLIFAAGFSTAAQVTNVSGRGVGMDVVKTNIEGIGGQIELKSRPGEGTTTRLKIPLTLAIVPAMIIGNRGERFAIPQVKLVELVRIDQNANNHTVEYVQGKPIYRLRGSLLPLIKLDQVLRLSRGEIAKNSVNAETKLELDFDRLPAVTNIVVLSADSLMFGLIVDEVLDTAEVVVKPLNPFLKPLAIYSGATVLGDGGVALILDVMGIAQTQNLMSEAKLHAKDEAHANSAPVHIGESQEFLLFKLNSSSRHAIPLGLVHRLEEFNKKMIEFSGEQQVVRYRNSLLPLINLNKYLNFNSPPTNSKPESDSVSVIVTQKGGKFYGIQVNEILDVLNSNAPMDDSIADRPGILGNFITETDMVVVVDILNILESLISKAPHDVTTKETQLVQNVTGKRILFAEDTTFFRRHVCTVLRRAGHTVTAVENGAEGIAILEKSNEGDFDLILSDIEMPKMNGIEFVKAIRANERLKGLPVIALTTRFSPADVEDGKRAGFNSYMEKLNPDKLLNAIAKIFEPKSDYRRYA